MQAKKIRPNDGRPKRDLWRIRTRSAQSDITGDRQQKNASLVHDERKPRVKVEFSHQSPRTNRNQPISLWCHITANARQRQEKTAPLNANLLILLHLRARWLHFFWNRPSVRNVRECVDTDLLWLIPLRDDMASINRPAACPTVNSVMK